MAELIPTERTKLKRLASRGSYERDTIDAILDEALVCHMGFVDGDQPFVIPTTFARVGDVLYVHGSAAGRTLRALRGGLRMCLTVTLLDGLVLARSAFHHSMNYRSVVVLGEATEVTDPAERLLAFRALVERLAPGRWSEVRWPDERESKATMVLRLPLVEASAKVRSGGPLDDAEDLGQGCWAGHVPLRLVASAPIADQALPAGIAPPACFASNGRAYA
jgi:nitroimidazol reductase NimA-like FMN-containing flavoprotein (pyridoxamine 5'-phosphate oxidase superfamily)